MEYYEEKLLGSGGTVRENKEFIGNEKDFCICYADNLCNIRLRDMIAYHRKHKGILTMALFRTNVPKQCGIAEMDEDGKIIKFTEKPECPESNLANAGIYVADRRIWEYCPAGAEVDFGRDILPQLIGRMYGWEINDYLIDIGTMDNYKRAKEEWKYDYYKDSLTR